MPRVVDDVMMTSTLHCRLRFCWLNPLPTTMDASDGGAFNERILEGLRPNFFELLSQEAMHNALRPACQYFMKTLVQSRPDLLNHVWKYADEIYAILETVLQVHFIRRHAASLSECFYSLKRVSGSGGSGTLSRTDCVASVLCMVAVPYLKVKLDLVYSKLQEIDDATPLRWWSGCGLKHTAAVGFFRVYPYICSLWEASNFAFRLLYLFKKTNFYSPLLWLTGLSLERSPEEEAELGSGNIILQWVGANFLPILVFFLKFLEWWYSAERSAAVRMMTSLPIPPPPRGMKPNPAGIQLPSDPSLCPLCIQHRGRPTALATSGYVYCYQCIHDYVSKHGECPVTCLPTSPQQLIRLFIQQ